MKIATRFVLTAALLVAATGGTANAQVLDTMTFKTNFPFVAGNTTMPAGSYTVRPLEDDPSLLELSNGRLAVLLETEGESPRQPPSKDEVSFNKYGNTYVLHEIISIDSQSGAVMLPSRAEKRRQKQHGTATQQTVPATKASKKSAK